MQKVLAAAPAGKHATRSVSASTILINTAGVVIAKPDPGVAGAAVAGYHRHQLGRGRAEQCRGPSGAGHEGARPRHGAAQSGRGRH